MERSTLHLLLRLVILSFLFPLFSQAQMLGDEELMDGQSPSGTQPASVRTGLNAHQEHASASHTNVPSHVAPPPLPPLSLGALRPPHVGAEEALAEDTTPSSDEDISPPLRTREIAGAPPEGRLPGAEVTLLRRGTPLTLERSAPRPIHNAGRPPLPPRSGLLPPAATPSTTAGPRSDRSRTTATRGSAGSTREDPFEATAAAASDTDNTDAPEGAYGDENLLFQMSYTPNEELHRQDRGWTYPLDPTVYRAFQARFLGFSPHRRREGPAHQALHGLLPHPSQAEHTPPPTATLATTPRRDAIEEAENDPDERTRLEHGFLPDLEEEATDDETDEPALPEPLIVRSNPIPIPPPTAHRPTLSPSRRSHPPASRESEERKGVGAYFFQRRFS